MKNFKFKPVLWSFLIMLPAILIWFCTKSPKEQGVENSVNSNPPNGYETYLASGSTATIAPESQLGGGEEIPAAKCKHHFIPNQTAAIPNLTWQMDVIETLTPNPDAPGTVVASFRHPSTPASGGQALSFGQTGAYPVTAGRYYWFFGLVSQQAPNPPFEVLSTGLGDPCNSNHFWQISHFSVTSVSGTSSSTIVFGYRAKCSSPCD